MVRGHRGRAVRRAARRWPVRPAPPRRPRAVVHRRGQGQGAHRRGRALRPGRRHRADAGGRHPRRRRGLRGPARVLRRDRPCRRVDGPVTFTRPTRTPQGIDVPRACACRPTSRCGDRARRGHRKLRQARLGNCGAAAGRRSRGGRLRPRRYARGRVRAGRPDRLRAGPRQPARGDGSARRPRRGGAPGGDPGERAGPGRGDVPQQRDGDVQRAARRAAGRDPHRRHGVEHHGDGVPVRRAAALPAGRRGRDAGQQHLRAGQGRRGGDGCAAGPLVPRSGDHRTAVHQRGGPGRVRHVRASERPGIPTQPAVLLRRRAGRCGGRRLVAGPSGAGAAGPVDRGARHRQRHPDRRAGGDALPRRARSRDARRVRDARLDRPRTGADRVRADAHLARRVPAPGSTRL